MPGVPAGVSKRANRRKEIFSPLFATFSDRISPRDPPPAGKVRASSTSWGALALTSAAILLASSAKSSVLATKSVSQLTSTSAPELPSRHVQTTPSEAIREDFFAAAARPFLRRVSIAPSMSPPAAASAVLQSIMPAPVFSRRSFTIPDVICIPLDLPDRSGPWDPDLFLRPGGLRSDGDFLVPLGGDERHGDLRRLRLLVAAGGVLLRVRRLPLDDRVGHLGQEQLDRADRVVVPWDHDVDQVRVAVRVDDGDDGDPEASGLEDRDRLPLRVDDEHRVRNAPKLPDAAQGLFQLHPLLLELEDFLLREPFGGAVGSDLGELLQPIEALADRREVGEHPAQPTLVDVGRAGPAGLLFDRLQQLLHRDHCALPVRHAVLSSFGLGVFPPGAPPLPIYPVVTGHPGESPARG